jgi:IS30 family transposase
MNMDLPRKVKYKKRKADRAKLSEETKLAVLSRNYVRFLEYTKQHPDFPVVEMDTVIGTQTSEKVLLTLLFRSCNLMLIYLLEHKNQECVIHTLNGLSEAMGIVLFQKMFPIILTDRGTEFLFPEALECDQYGEIKTRVFYCDPQASWQKPQIERNHEFIRYVLPKGHSFDALGQEDIDLLRDHINSYSRPQYNGATPYQLSRLLMDHRLHDALHLREIPADDVTLKPSLLLKR